jgi:hypothetical protein
MLVLFLLCTVKLIKAYVYRKGLEGVVENWVRSIVALK